MEKTLANEGAVSNLDHIYFFVAKTETANANHNAERSPSPVSASLSRSVSPSVGSSDGSGTGSSSSSTAFLNPQAASFEPKIKSLPPPASRLFEVREIPGKGLGLFATDFIELGTCIIAEAPLFRIPENALHLAWGPYCKLSKDSKKAFDALHLYRPQHLHLEQASKLHLIDCNDEDLNAGEIDALIEEQVRVMGTFACNNFQCGTGLAVFDITSRLNHSCVPNVHHSFNPTLGKETVFAMRAIQPGEELCTTYLDGSGVYQVRAQRIESLRTNYGFTCTCPACSDVTGQSDGRREVMGSIAYGLALFQYGNEAQDSYGSFVPNSPASALVQAEALVHLLLDEGILSIELCKAYLMASTVALTLKGYNKARDYALAEAEIEQNCLGTALNDLVKQGVGAASWVEQVRRVMVKAGVLGHGQKLKKAKTEAQRAARSEKKRASKLRKAAENAAAKQKQDGKHQKNAEKAAAKKARDEALKEEERKRKEYEMAFPNLKG